MSIFVSVAAYRDPELVPTVLDCLAKADRPDDLRIVVNWQHQDDEDVSALRDDPRVELLEFDARQSRGVCWARAKIQKRYAGEDWFLQVDSHTRFAEHWDTRVLAMAAQTGSPKPIITCYPPRYDPSAEFTGAGNPTVIYIGEWTVEGLPRFKQRRMTDWQERTAPMRARFLAGGFLFAPGSLVTEVPYDDQIYAQGEEINLATRAFTWGYDLFHPVEVLAWHFYIRTGNPRHSVDHRAWRNLDRPSRRRVLAMLHYPMTGYMAAGTHRTIADYEAYADVDFKRRTARAAATIDEPAAFQDHAVGAPQNRAAASQNHAAASQNHAAASQNRAVDEPVALRNRVGASS